MFLLFQTNTVHVRKFCIGNMCRIVGVSLTTQTTLRRTHPAGPFSQLSTDPTELIHSWPTCHTRSAARYTTAPSCGSGQRPIQSTRPDQADGDRRRRSAPARRGASPAGSLQPRARAAGVPGSIRDPLARRRGPRVRRRPLRRLPPSALPWSTPP
jgi:hypothetical protein